MTGACFQRCAGMTPRNAVFSTTYEIDARHGTEYHRRFVNGQRMAGKGLDFGSVLRD